MDVWGWPKFPWTRPIIFIYRHGDNRDLENTAFNNATVTSAAVNCAVIDIAAVDNARFHSLADHPWYS